MPVPLCADGRHDLGGFLAAITDRTRVIILCTAQQSDGPGVDEATRNALALRAFPEHGVRITIGEREANDRVLTLLQQPSSIRKMR